MKSILNISIVICCMYLYSCDSEIGRDGWITVSGIYPNPSQVGDTITVAILEVDFAPIQIDSLDEVVVIINNRIDFVQRTVGFFAIPNQFLGNYIKNPLDSSGIGSKYVQFIATDPLISGGKLRVFLRNFEIRSDSILILL